MRTRAFGLTLVAVLGGLLLFDLLYLQGPAVVIVVEPIPPPPPVAAAERPWRYGCNGSLPRIHIPLSVTTRNLSPSPIRVMDVPLVKYALTSLVTSMEPDAFDYAIYVGADSGDPWLDSKDRTRRIQNWFQTAYQEHWGKDSCVPPLEFYVYNNTHSHPTWAINYVTQVAFERGYQYFYRINDDTILSDDQWSSQFVRALAAMRPLPNVGVVAPFDPLNSEIMTHSCVSREHIHLFGAHFNFHYGNVYSDPWIKEVYSPPYPESFGSDAAMARVLPTVKVKHVYLKTRYETKSNIVVTHEKQVAIDRENVQAYVVKKMKVKKPLS